MGLAKVVRCKDCKHRHSSEFCECRPDDAFCVSAADNVPLTLDQLKGSMGEPLWLVDEADQWISIVEVDSDRIWFTTFGDDQTYFLWTCSYGNVCQIYRRKP